MIATYRTWHITSRFRGLLSAVVMMVFLQGPVRAQETKADASPADESAALDELFKWTKGPGPAALGAIAEVQLPKGFRFVGADDTRRFLEMNRNPTNGSELGLLGPSDLSWFAVFEFDPIGYVKDDEKADLDADRMLASMKEGNQQGNEERKRRGWPTLELVGWEKPPAYDTETNNLEWATQARSGNSAEVNNINYNTRRLGRNGVMQITLVASPEDLKTAVPEFKTLMKSYKFTVGNTYAEFRSGDKVAQYGLAALVTGGAAAVALKTGLLQKFWKAIVVGVIALAAGAKKIFSSLFGRKQSA